MNEMLVIVGGFLAVLIAAFVEAVASFARQARPGIGPRFLKTPFKWAFEALWVILLLGGGVMLLFEWWVLALGAVVGFWLILPFLIQPVIRNRLLPPWDEVKTELAPLGYTEKDYWRGDWWMVEERRKKKKRK